MRYQPQPKTNHIHTTLSFLAIAAIVFIGYNYFDTKQVSAVDSSLVTPDAPAAGGTASPLSVIQLHNLDKIEALQLDGSILKDPAFLGLQDTNVDLIPEDAGRPNPFIPLSGSVSGTAATQATSAKTPSKR